MTFLAAPRSTPHDVHPPPRGHRIRSALLDALAVVAPTTCSGCGAQDRAVCDGCAQRLRAEPRTVRVGPLHVAVGLAYEGAARAVLAAFKDGGRTDAARYLAPALAASVEHALDLVARENEAPDREAPRASGGIRLATIPSSRAAFRQRGFVPVAELLEHAGMRAPPALRAVRQAADQSGLTLEERRANREGWLRARASVAGERVLLVDDILTTGATLREAARALERAGARVVGAAVLARTPRRSADPEIK